MMWRSLCISITTFSMVACGARENPGVVIDTLPGGIERVRNLGTIDTAFTDSGSVRLVLDHTIAPPEGEPGSLGMPMHAVAHPDGRLFVFDTRPVGIKVFGPDGRFQRSIGREGSGPGEFRDRALLWLVGDSLIVSDMANGRAVVLATEGTQIRSFPVPCCYNIRSVADDSGRIPVGTSVRPASSGSFMDGFGWIRYLTDGSVVDTIIAPYQGGHKTWQITTPRGVFPHPIPYTPTRHFALQRDGTMLFGEDNQGQLVFSRTGRDTSRIVELPLIVPQVVADSDRTAMLEANQKWATSIGGVLHGDPTDIPAHLPLWYGVSVDEASRIWIRTAGGFLIFSHEGILLGRTRLASPDSEMMNYWTRDRMYRLTFSANDEPVIEVYRIEVVEDGEQ